MVFRFETLEIWQMAKEYATRVYAVTAKFPRHEDYGLKSQLNRAVNSIVLNIAEGTAKNSNKAFDYHLEIALGSTFEVGAVAFLARIERTSQRLSTVPYMRMVSDLRKA
ncbi:MAG: four helix bundle protein [Nitrospirota bacterium]